MKQHGQVKQDGKANTFHAMHDPARPLVLYNVWDAATAKAACDVGAKAIATGSWSLAAAQGYLDGQNIPLDVVIQIVSRIVETIDVPVSVDFECGYADDLDSLADNLKKVIETGAVGINFEDQIIGQGALQSVTEQARRLERLSTVAAKSGVTMFINARTDMFLLQKETERHADLLDAALLRGRHYADAGATGFFVPGLSDEKLISQICEAATLPINIMTRSNAVDAARLGQLGVSRVSHGPYPFFEQIESFKKSACTAINGV